MLAVICGVGEHSGTWVLGEEKEGGASEKQDVTPGHSFHAEAFNEGPRQAAYLMQGMGNVHWKTSSANPMAQRFFDQGLAQLHGFWYFEAERSFRQAASIEPERAIFYWGMARANAENPERSAGFIEQAMKRLEKSNSIERRLIEAWSRRVKDWPQPPESKPAETPEDKKDQKQSTEAAAKKSQGSGKKKRGATTDEVRDKRNERLKNYVRDLEDLAQDFPVDLYIMCLFVLKYVLK